MSRLGYVLRFKCPFLAVSGHEKPDFTKLDQLKLPQFLRSFEDRTLKVLQGSI